MTDNPKKLECEQAIKMILEFLDNELERPDKHAMQAHLDTCRSCYTRMEFEKRLKGIVKVSEEEKAPDDLRDRIKSITKLF